MSPPLPPGSRGTQRCMGPKPGERSGDRGADPAATDIEEPIQRRTRRKRKPRGTRAASPGLLEPTPVRTPNEVLTPLARQKRTNALRRWMDEPVTVMYLEMCKRSGQNPMVGPDPADARISKRQWEKSFRRFTTHVVWARAEGSAAEGAAEGSAAGSKAAMDANAEKRTEAATKALVMRGASLRKVADAPSDNM